MASIAILLFGIIACGFLLSSGEGCKNQFNTHVHNYGKRSVRATADGNSDKPKSYDDHYKEFFTLMDQDGDGIINYKEGLSFYARIDRDHDGMIEGREFKKL